jgi:hypothetical protein
MRNFSFKPIEIIQGKNSLRGPTNSNLINGMMPLLFFSTVTANQRTCTTNTTKYYRYHDLQKGNNLSLINFISSPRTT